MKAPEIMTSDQQRLFAEPDETQAERCNRILAEAEASGVKWRRPSKRRKAHSRSHKRTNVQFSNFHALRAKRSLERKYGALT